MDGNNLLVDWYAFSETAVIVIVLAMALIWVVIAILKLLFNKKIG